MILINLIGAIVQLIVFALLPFLVYVVINRTAKGFLFYTGFHRTTYSAVALAANSLPRRNPNPAAPQ
jgi:hypothetical protein